MGGFCPFCANTRQGGGVISMERCINKSSLVPPILIPRHADCPLSFTSIFSRVMSLRQVCSNYQAVPLACQRRFPWNHEPGSLRGLCFRQTLADSISRLGTEHDILGLVSSDVCGPMHTPGSNGEYYKISFLHRKSNFAVSFSMKTKDEAVKHIQSFHVWAKRKTGKKLKILRTDNGTEYVNRVYVPILMNMVSSIKPP